MAEPELFEQEGIVTEEVCGLLRIHERSNRVNLGIVMIRLQENPESMVVGFTHGVSDEENRIHELLRAVWGESFDRPSRPSIRSVTGEAIVRIPPRKILPLARTQCPRRSRLDSGWDHQAA